MSTGDDGLHDVSERLYLDSLRVLAQKSYEHEDQIKTLTSKILVKMKSNDKNSPRGNPMKLALSNNLDIFTAILQSTHSIHVIANVTLILQDLLESKLTKKKSLTSLHGQDSSTVIFQVMPLISRDSHCPENILPTIFSILLKLAHKDPQFPTKVRTNGGLASIMSVMKTNTRNSQLLKYLMQVLKICLKNSTNITLLGKEGLVPTLLTVITFIGRRTTFLLKLALELMGQMARNRINISRIVRHNGISKILKILDNWNKYTGDNKLKICKANIILLGLISDYSAGIKAIVEEEGILHLHKFVTSLPPSETYDTLLLMGSVVLQKCLPRLNLPLVNANSTYQFPVFLRKDFASTTTMQSNSTSLSSTSATVEISSAEQSREKKQTISKFTSKVPQTNKKNCESKEMNSETRSFERSSLSKEELRVYKSYFDELNVNTLKVDLIQEPFCNSNEKVLDKKQQEVAQHKRLIREEVYKEMSESTQHIASFIKLAYPDMYSKAADKELEPLYNKDPAVCRLKLLENIKRAMNPQDFSHNIVYDLDELLDKVDHNDQLNNDDEARIGIRDSVKHLKFESRFESGNLRKAIQIGPFEYELILSPDINSNTHIQWFYFEVSNMDSIFPYTFHIVNCEKQNSQFNFGMKPVFFSVKEALLGRPGWIRFGTDICYYKNVYSRERPASEDSQDKSYFTASFTFQFPHAYDICYLAYHFPYPYTMLKTDIYVWKNMYDENSIYFKSEELCKSLGGNSIPILTITSKNQMQKGNRDYIFFTSRVHPGESNSSWVMKGCLDFLLSDNSTARNLREMYIFKLVPMLNADGVINGCHRCDLTAEDMNRCWLQPSREFQPPIYHTKALLLYLASISKSPLVYCDFHGHSRKKNIFLYGCSNRNSWNELDQLKNEESINELLPRILSHIAPAFSIENCSYDVEKIRESTARVTVWRQANVQASYTMESSYCGCDKGLYQGMHLGIKHQEEMGRKFCHALLYINPRHRELNISNIIQDEIRLHEKAQQETKDKDCNLPWQNSSDRII